mgnify:CR=1 FL=1
MDKNKLLLPDGTSAAKNIHKVQKNLFIVQAELAGSKMSITEEKVKEVETIVDECERNEFRHAPACLPPVEVRE